MKTENVELGRRVVSTQGRDKGESYLIVGVKGDRILVADGCYKKLEKPKLKNLSHLKSTNDIDEEINVKLKTNKKINDLMIEHALLKFSKNKENQYGK